MNLKRLLRSLATALAGTLVVFAIVIGAGLMLSGSSPDLSYRTLDYDVAVQADGSLKVTQHIDMKLRTRDGDTPWRQLYQKYTLREDGLTNITDISVRNVTAGENYEQGALASPADHSDTSWDREYAGHWYIADVTDGAENPQPFDPAKDGYEISDNTTSRRSKDVEIGWSIPATKKASSLKFDVTMTLHGGTTLYKDVASWQWEPFGDSNLIPIGKVTGIVRFPDGIDASSSWAWLHYAGVSETSRMDDGSLRFSASDVRAGQYLDVVAAYDASAVKPPSGWRQGDAAWVRRQTGRTYLPKLKQSEGQQEIAWRQQQAGPARVRVALWIAVVLAGLVLFAIGMVAAVRSYRESQYHGDIEYWRDQPGISPASAARLITLVDASATGSSSDRELTATMLSLAVKKAIAIYPGPADMYRGIDMSQATPVGLIQMITADPGKMNAARNTSTIVILPASLDAASNIEQLGLSQSEEALLALLITISQRVGCPVFDLNQMKNVCKDWASGYLELNKFTDSCAAEYSPLTSTASSQWAVAGVLAVVLGLGALIVNGATGFMVAGMITGSPLLLVGLFCLLGGTSTALTEPGHEMAGRCLGLKRYMQDFSNFADRGAADIAMWDWYMVYAAAFGISERVMKELAKAYPQVNDPAWLDANAAGTLFYWNYRPYGWYGGRYYGDSATADQGNLGAAGPVPAYGGTSFAGGFSDLGSQLSAGFADISSTIQAAAPSSDSGGDFGSFGSGGGSGFGGSFGGSGGGSFGGR